MNFARKSYPSYHFGEYIACRREILIFLTILFVPAVDDKNLIQITTKGFAK